MKKLMLLATILGVLLLVGCIPPEGAQVCNPPYTQVGEKCCMDLNANSVCDAEEKPFQPGAVPGKVLMQQLAVALDATGGYSYKYGKDQDTFKIFGDTVKKELVRQTKVVSEEPVGSKKTTIPWIDVIYFDTANKQAAAYCEGLDDTGERMCTGFDLWDIAIPVDYDKFYEMTPTDWINAFMGKEPAEVKENYRFEIPGLEMTGLVFVEEGKTTMLDLDIATGIVWRATVDEDGYVTEYRYSDVAIGTGVVQHEFKTAPEKPVLSETGDPAIPVE